MIVDNVPELNPEISVVIPAYRGRSTIADCLESIVVASKGHSIEIIVVESSNDGTIEFIGNEFPFVRVVAIPYQISAGQARNTGALESKGKYVFL